MSDIQRGSKDPMVRCTPNSWGMPSRAVGVAAEGLHSLISKEKQWKCLQMFVFPVLFWIIGGVPQNEGSKCLGNDLEKTCS